MVLWKKVAALSSGHKNYKSPVPRECLMVSNCVLPINPISANLRGPNLYIDLYKGNLREFRLSYNSGRKSQFIPDELQSKVGSKIYSYILYVHY